MPRLGSIRKVSRKISKIRRSGFNTLTCPESSTPLNQLRHSNRLTAIGNVSADQLLSAYVGTLRDRNSLRMSTVPGISPPSISRSEEHTSELQSRQYLVCRLLLEQKTHARRTVNNVDNRARHISLAHTTHVDLRR